MTAFHLLHEGQDCLTQRLEKELVKYKTRAASIMYGVIKAMTSFISEVKLVRWSAEVQIESWKEIKYPGLTQLVTVKSNPAEIENW
jgi:hypothetical protein